MDKGLFSDSLHFSNGPITHHLTSSQKRANQWCRWSQDVIPSCLIPYLSYIQLTSALCYTNMPGQPQQDLGVCRAGCKTWSITVACVHFNLLKEIDIIACPCFPAPLQLLCCGLFPCAPVAPSLAVDLHILEFIRLLFVCQSPNQTAWCNAVETFLDGMGYKLLCENNLCHCFGNAFHWYRVLTIMAHNHISTLITDIQKGQAHLPPIDKPSEYLHSHCLLCFGGNTYHGSDSHSIPDIIVCIDACFTQKHSTNPCSADTIDPPNPTPTFFLSGDNVKAMEDFIQSCRGERCRVRVSRAEGNKDHYEEGMHVPVSVLNRCRESFVAADEKREKASTCFFTDTGLMALLCRHDHWKFLDNNTLSCISFAIVVFHAYGHQWPCQIVYHPRKCEGFGLSDGEGCEQLWSSLKQLIPLLQVSGFYQHLFVLDVQVRHLDTKSIQGYGHWLHWQWIHCQMKKNMALDSLLDLDINKDMLRQSKNKVVEVIITILALEKTLDAYETSVHELEMQLYLSNTRSQCAKTTDTLQCHKAALEMQAKANLKKMKNNTYLTVCLNALNLEHKIRASTQYSIKHQEPRVLKLVSTYNGLCAQLWSLICQQRAPPSAVPPRPIIHKGIFLLDINDEIWQDIGLDEDSINPLAWLSDEATRSGIHLQLEVDQCIEEETRLMRERTIMQEWMFAEWEAIQTVLRAAVDDLVVSFHMWARTDKLLHICVIWKKKVQEIPCTWPVESWGPQNEDLLRAA
ncbi:uncharacterized protein BJ212DRAFT_1449388 [Suillus subaureus]|uniref:CxC1-like cysteine cluster associated with KDZ transposases domain-containing protein n=1 Tax=Suillus subaureus TaxID=48587 RepID=A0A9P7J808_9AGAM|nr:uncharacterized protein BJ212DRAFT_1449388 [Suillus subaureus]KAG1807137.1 hypothetical protein BJ212DRAFT_1449388 [Suillus subaureus]